ncbi:MAG TPA: adenosine kinase [Tenuifilaceae bacterium]|nr:adenosine kinase [Tenuifilaceae bacterium]HPM89624.1 adenosine kinase [Tenuifilaceae bacterium]HPW26539.1 adenosine kinase [Tenuifilaceae bacterium]
MPKVLGLGNALVDIMTQLPNDGLLETLKLPKGSMQLVDEGFMRKAISFTRDMPQSLSAGGGAANTIHGLANMDVATSFIGKIGDDVFGRAFKTSMEEVGINPIMLKGKAESGRTLALVSTDSERTFAVYLGAALELTAVDLKPEMFEGFDYFHVEGYLVQNHEMLLRALEIASAKGLQISFDLASYNVVEENRDFLNEIVKKYVTILFANEDEAKAFTGKKPREAVEVLAEIVPIAVVKLGPSGSYIKRNSDFYEVGIIDVSSIDTTGAGDLYASGFLYGLMKGLPLDKCGQIGAILSGHVIEVLGPKMDGERWTTIRRMVAEAET